MEFKILSDANEEILALRTQAFVIEKNVPKNIEFDGKDDEYMHFCVYDNGSVVGCARVNPSGEALHIGRVAVNTLLRGKGYGRKLFEFIENYAKENHYKSLELGAIETAVGFYEKMGFITVGDYFEEAGWPHVDMIKIIG